MRIWHSLALSFLLCLLAISVNVADAAGTGANPMGAVGSASGMPDTGGSALGSSSGMPNTSSPSALQDLNPANPANPGGGAIPPSTQQSQGSYSSSPSANPTA